MKKWKSHEWCEPGRKQCDQCLLCDGLNLEMPYTPSHKPGLSVSFIKICDRLDIVAAGKRAFLAVREAWNHQVRVGIIQMNKLWVGILILGKHLSLERERAAADSFSPSVPFLTASSNINPLSSAPFVFTLPTPPPLFLVPVWYSLVMCFHVSVNTYWVYSILHPLPEKWDEGEPWRPFILLLW